MTEQTTPARCQSCGRKLTAASSVAAGRGPVCRGKVRRAAATVELPVKPEQRAKAIELIEDGGIVPLSRPGVYAAASSDGTTTYVVNVPDQTCTCKAGLNGRYCYHLAAALILSAATGRRAA
jgi:hypothetical protein